MNASRLASLFVLPVLAVSARAELQLPRSLLVFPLADARTGVSCVLTVTNVNPDPAASLFIEVVFVASCFETNRTYSLPGLDTKPILCANQFPINDRGYAYVFAKNSHGRAVSANDLIGSAIVLDAAVAQEFQYSAIAFASPRPEGQPTDVDMDNRRDLDGIEYSASPEELLFPRFLGQSAPYASDLVLVNLSGGGDFSATVNLRIWNDDRQQFSAQHSFRCWTRVRLSTISGLFDDAFLLANPNNPSENAFGRETGWFIVDGHRAAAGAHVITDPAVLALLVEPASLSSASLPFARGTQANGALMPIPYSAPKPPALPPNGGILGG